LALIDQWTEQQKIVDRARDASFALETQSNADAEKRLNQINKIVHDSAAELLALENKTVKDLVKEYAYFPLIMVAQ
jgi:hypothetical protein